MNDNDKYLASVFSPEIQPGQREATLDSVEFAEYVKIYTPGVGEAICTGDISDGDFGGFVTRNAAPPPVSEVPPNPWRKK